MSNAVEILAKGVRFSGRVCSYLVPAKLMGRIRLLGSFFHTGFVSRRFKSVGEGTIISKGSVFHCPECISIGRGCRIGYGSRLSAVCCEEGRRYKPEISIGNNTIIGSNCFITCIDNVTIGHSCLFGANVLISDNSHGSNEAVEMSLPPATRELFSKGPVRIGNKVWIGEKASILPGVTIGDGAVIGANAVVTKDVPPFSVAVGAPARIVRQIISDSYILANRH